MAFTLPNNADAYNTNQSELDSKDIDILISAYKKIGVVSGEGNECNVTFSSGRSFIVDTGEIISGGTRRTLLSTNTVTLPVSSTSGSRFDIIGITSGGVVTCVVGSATGTGAPFFPSLAVGFVALAAIYVDSDTLASNRIIDKRVILDIENPWINKINNFTAIGHSYIAGSTQVDSGTSNVYQESVVAKLSGLLGVHEINVTHLGQAGSSISQTRNVIQSQLGGYVGVLQFVWPNNSIAINAQADVVVTDPVASSMNGAAIVVHGVNDLQLGGGLTACVGQLPYPINGTDQSTYNIPGYVQKQMLQNRTAAKNGYRTVFSRFRAGAVFGTSISTGGIFKWDTSVTTAAGTWSDIRSVSANSGPGYIETSVSGAQVITTIPSAFRGGTVGFNFIADGNALTFLAGGTSSTATVITASDTGVSAAEFAAWPTAGTAVIQVDDEQMLVTSGFGTRSWTVTRGVNGTSNVAHSDKALIFMPENCLKVIWSTNGSNASVSGDTYLYGQGTVGSLVSVTKRFVLTSADAGKTITATVSNLVSGNTSARVRFDSWWIEDAEPPPIVATNVFDYNYTNVVTAVRAEIPAFNSMLTAVAGEFTDGFVRIADVDTLFRNRNGVIGTTITSTDTTSTVAFTANSTSFTPVVGMQMDFGYFLGENTTILGVTSNGGTSWTLDLARGANGSSRWNHTSGQWLGAMDWMHTDHIHINVMGHSVFAETIYREFAKMPLPQRYQIAQVMGNWSQDSQKISMGIVDDWSLTVPATSLATTTAITAGTQWFSPIYVPRISAIVGVGVFVGTPNATSRVRMGIYLPDHSHSRPGRLLQDVGHIGTTAANGIGTFTSAPMIACYQVVRPGWYWLSGQHTGPSANYRYIAGNGFPYPGLMASEGTFDATSNSVIGFCRTRSLAITSPAPLTDVDTLGNSVSPVWAISSSSQVPRMRIRLRAPAFA